MLSVVGIEISARFRCSLVEVSGEFAALFVLVSSCCNSKGLIVNDVFQVAVIIEKLPPLWKDLKNYLKYKLKEITIEDLIVSLRIEEDSKAAEKRSHGNSAYLE